MATYTYYWPEWACLDARAVGLEGKPVPLFFGGHNADSDFSRFKIGPGDTAVAITVVDGELFLLASLVVREKATADHWLARHPEHAPFRSSRGGGQVLAGDPVAPLSFARRVPPRTLVDWRYDSGKEGRPLKHLEAGKLKRQGSLQGVYRVTAATAGAIARLLSEEPPAVPSVDARIDGLIERLRRSPSDDASAAVLADLWQEQGDPRGQLVALDLAIVRALEGNDEATLRGAAAAHLELVRRRGMKAALAAPGGFPFRAVYTSRDHVVWSTAGVDPSLAAFEAIEARLAPWAEVGAIGAGRFRRRTTREQAAGRARDDLWLELSVRHPSFGCVLPYQSKPFVSERSHVAVDPQGRWFMKLVLPFTSDGPTLRATLASVRASWPGFRGPEERGHSLTLWSWAGRAASRSELPLRFG